MRILYVCEYYSIPLFSAEMGAFSKSSAKMAGAIVYSASSGCVTGVFFIRYLPSRNRINSRLPMAHK